MFARLKILLLIAPLSLLTTACSPLANLRALLHLNEPTPDITAFPVMTADEDDFTEGKRHLAAGELGLAVENLRKVLSTDRGHVPAMNALAAAYDRLGRFDLADRYYDRALMLDGNDPQTLNNAGFSQLLRGNPRQARILLERAAGFAPNDTIITANLAKLRQSEATAIAQDEVQQDRPERLSRSSLNSWRLARSQGLQPARLVLPAPKGSAPDEPPPPLRPPPRPVVLRADLPALSSFKPR